jgi:hydroxymethylpyrimidine pyrophosphatase-like HAD family hydrolase
LLDSCKIVAHTILAFPPSINQLLMRYQALATDYDGTLAHDGRVSPTTAESLQAFLATGRGLVMVTGRELPELLEVCHCTDLFEWIVAENGALLYRPSTKEEKPLAEPPPPNFLKALAARKVDPVSVGRVIVATWEPHEKAVLEVIHELGIEWQVIFNKGAVMALPTGVNKATGLTAALEQMALSPHNVVAVGDAENDHSFLKMCAFSAAVSNALPAVKDTADLVTRADHGDGVSELIQAIIDNDLVKAAGKIGDAAANA